MMARCKHGKTVSDELIESLPENQGGPGRHKCVVCAYKAGINAGKLLPKSKEGEAWVLRNKNYYIVFPPCSGIAAHTFTVMAKAEHGIKLSYAQLTQRIVSKLDLLTAGTLNKRSL